MFRLVLGRSKSGKTEFVREYLSALATQGENKLLMIVPDQQTFDTEKAFLERLGPKDAMNVKVLGFSRLCDYVFDVTGYVPKTVADESVRSLVMSMALEDTADHLQMYSEKALSTDLLSMMLSVHKEFVRSKVTPELLLNSDTKGNSILSKKLHDTSLVLSAYDALLSSSFDDAESELSVACDLLLRHRVFEDYTICVDSYLSFTALELDVLRSLMNQSKELLVTLSDDGKNSEDSIFEVSKSTAKRLTAMAKEDGVKVSSPIICDYKEFFTQKELLHIEQNIFDYPKQCEKLCISDNPPVHIYSAQNIYEESDFVARSIRELVLTKGYRYKDIAVVCRDVSPYRNVLDTALAKYDVSYFMDTAGSIHSKPLIKLITACFDCVNSSFDKDYVLALLKSGLVKCSVTDAAAFENYVFTWGISGSKFLCEFTANPRGFCDDFTSEDLFELSKIENLRKTIIEPLTVFRKNIKDATAEDICKELYNLLITLGVDVSLLALCDAFEFAGEAYYSEELTRLWQMLMDTLDRTISVIGKRRISTKRFCELLRIQFTAQDMSFIPRAADQVTVGDIERLRLSDKKVLFVIGAVEGEFPRAAGDSGIFTSLERSILCEAGVLNDSLPDVDFLREQYLCYYALTGASDKLFISYPGANLKGGTVAPSEIVTEIQSLFENLSVTSYSDVPILDRLWSTKASFDIYASRIRSEDNVTLALKDYYSNNDEYKSSLDALQSAIDSKEIRIKDPKISEKLFGSNMYLSASKVEKYYMCGFAYFCQYGLRLQERRTAAMDSLETGTFVHFVLEHFVKTYTKTDMLSMTEDRIGEIVESLTAEYAQTHFGGFEDKTPRFKYLFDRISRNIAMLIRHLIEELLQSSFTPKAFELDIGKDIPAYSLTLPAGRTITITGKVDRADIMQKDGKNYIRILDYKTGTKVFDLSDVMYGLNLQMLIYLSAIGKNGGDFFGGEVVPAGVLYMPALTPVVSAAFGEDEESIIKNREKELCMNGLVLRDMDILTAMDKNIAGLYIPAKLQKNGNLSGANSLATLEEFGAVFARIDKLVAEMASELLQGNVSANPAKNLYDACKYCSYSSVCRHKDTDKERNIYKLQRDEIRKELGLEEEV